MKINPKWADDAVKQIKSEAGFNFVISEPIVAKWLVTKLVEEDIPFKVINNGAGVKTITSDTEVCPKCGGRGRI